MDSEISNRKVNNKVQHVLPPKKFETRNSMLTDLMENVHIQTIHNLAWVFVVCSQLHGLLHNYTTYGRLSLSIDYFQTNFSKPYLFLYVWVCIFLAALLPFFGFVLWAKIRSKISKLSVLLFDRLSLITFIAYTMTYAFGFAFQIRHCDFEPGTATTLMFELVWLKMKFYAFVRSNAPRTMRLTHHHKDQILYPDISKCLYFLFVPTLIYQDEYPRSKSIRWKRVAEDLVNFAGTVLLLNAIMEQFESRLKIFNANPFSWINFLAVVVECAPLSGLAMLGGFYSGFHCWPNAVAEMLRFSDRSFYQDFWTSTTYGRFLRTWSGIIQDWLYVYVYKDSYETIWPNKLFARAMVFVVSAFYHEFIMRFVFSVASWSYFSVIFLYISFIVHRISFNSVSGNFLLLLLTSIGSSIMICGYGSQYYLTKMQ